MRKKIKRLKEKRLMGGGGMETLGILWHEKKTKFGYKYGCSK